MSEAAGVLDVHAHVDPAGLITDLAAGRVRFLHVDVRRRDGGHTVAFRGGPPTRPLAAW